MLHRHMVDFIADVQILIFVTWVNGVVDCLDGINQRVSATAVDEFDGLVSTVTESRQWARWMLGLDTSSEHKK
ncbi:hypothetical protein D3C71_1774160 [compost metagenome]